MGGGGTQSNSGQQSLATLSPVGAGIGNLFGQGLMTNRGGGVTIGSTPSFILPQVFTPDTFKDLGNLATPVNPVQFDLGQLGGYAQGAANTLGEAAQTGLIGPATDLFSQLFKEKAAGIAEQSGLQGINANDIDFQSALLREAQLGSSQLADLAQTRRLQAAQLLPDSLNSLLGFEQGARATERGRTAAGQQFDLLQALGSINSQAGGTGFTKGSGKNWNVL